MQYIPQIIMSYMNMQSSGVLGVLAVFEGSTQTLTKIHFIVFKGIHPAI